MVFKTNYIRYSSALGWVLWKYVYFIYSIKMVSQQYLKHLYILKSFTVHHDRFVSKY